MGKTVTSLDTSYLELLGDRIYDAGVSVGFAVSHLVTRGEGDLPATETNAVVEKLRAAKRLVEEAHAEFTRVVAGHGVVIVPDGPYVDREAGDFQPISEMELELSDAG